MRAIVSIIFLIVSFSHAHEGGHDDGHNEPGAIKNGKLKGADDVVYLDAGPYVQWTGQKLKRKISSSNQVIYQYNDEVKDLAGLPTTDKNKYLELKVPGAEILKAFSFDHAGELHDMIEMISPDFSNGVVISKSKDLSLRWKADQTASMVRVIIEVYDSSGNLNGRLTVSTSDDGEFDVPTNLLSQLPEGEGKIAVKRIWLGEFQPKSEKNDMIGIKCVVSIVGKAKVLAD